MKKLTDDQTLQFIMLYKENSCLWDISTEDYKNKAMRQSALERICEGMKIPSLTVEDVKNKIKSIRSTYCLELDKIEKSITFGASCNVYEPKLKWFAEFDSFIKNVVVKRKTREYYIDNTEFEHVEQSEEPTHEDSNVDPPADPMPRKNKKRSRISQLSKIVSNVEETQYDLSKSETEDEFDVFGKHVAKQLRELSTKQAILGQEEIQRVITKRRLHDLKYTNTKRNRKYRYKYNPESIDAQISDDSTPGPSNICQVNIPLNIQASGVDMDSDDA